MAVDELGILLVQAEVERGERRDRPRDADRARPDSSSIGGEDVANMCGSRLEVGGEALGEADAAEVEARVERDAFGTAEDELGRAAADVDDDGPRRHLARRGNAAEGEKGLLVAAQKRGAKAVAPLDLAEESLPVLGVADGARRERERALGAGFLRSRGGSPPGRSERARSPGGGGCAARRRPRRAA